MIKKELVVPIAIEDAWKLVFDNDNVEVYMGCSLQKEDKAYIWTQKGTDNPLLVGRIVEKQYPKLLRLSTVNPHKVYKDKHPLEVVYQFEQVNEHSTKLTISQSGFEALPDKEQVYKENMMGWEFVLENLKRMI